MNMSMFLKLQAVAKNQLLMIWYFQEAVVKRPLDFTRNINAGGCGKSIIAGLKCLRNCVDAMHINYFGNLKTAVNTFLIVWNIKEIALKPFTFFYK